MTLNNFFEIVKETPKGATVRELCSKTIRNTGYLCGYETAGTDPRLEVDWAKDSYIENGQEKRHMKERLFKVLKTENGYKGSCGLHRTFTLDFVQPDSEHYFNHCD